MRNLLSLVLLTLLVAGCKKEETLITGDITGYVYCISPFYQTYPLEGAATVELMTDTLPIATHEAGENGQITFTDVPYGKYFMRVTKPGYIQAWTREPVYHAGGATPTIANTALYEVPTFQLVYDSTAYSVVYLSQVMYIHYTDPSQVPGPFSGFYYFAFFSEQPTVDWLTYDAAIKISGLTWDANADGVTDLIRGYISYPGSIFPTLSENLYLRLYPVAVGQGYYPAEVVPGAYGPASDVFEFKNPWVAR